MRIARSFSTFAERIGLTHCSGTGKLIGVGNGDPNCQESDKASKRSLFNGLAQVIIQSTKRPGEIHIEALKDGWEGPELMSAKLLITTKPVEPRPTYPRGSMRVMYTIGNNYGTIQQTIPLK